jgi:hypothetical protein
MKPRYSERQSGLWHRLLMFFGLISSLLLSSPPASASINIERRLLEQRVNAVRESLTADPASQVSDRETSSAGKLAQWMNWPNWPNWGNWPNWPNWGNWFNR